VSGLTPIDPSALPADIRTGSAARRQTYEGAMAFEQMLVQQLTTQLTAGAKAAGGDDDSGDGSGTTDTSGLAGPYASLLPGAFADGIEAGGGLGLAAQITDAIMPAKHPTS
jgi:hypothetical protein